MFRRNTYRKRRARTTAAVARGVLTFACILATFVLVSAFGARKLMAGHWFGLVAVAVLAAASLLAVAAAERIENPPTRVDVLPANRNPDVPTAPAQSWPRGELVEATEILPAADPA